MVLNKRLFCDCGAEVVYDPESQRNHSEYAAGFDCPSCGKRFSLAGTHALDDKYWRLVPVFPRNYEEP